MDNKHMSNIDIRPVTLMDVDQMVAWGRNAKELLSNKKDEWYTKESLTKWVENPGNDILFMAEVDGQPAGMCLTHCFVGWALGDSLYVDAKFRRLGIGRLLLEKTFVAVAAKGLSNYSLQVQEGNSEALALYKSVGLTEGYRFIWMDKYVSKPTVKNLFFNLWNNLKRIYAGFVNWKGGEQP